VDGEGWMPMRPPDACPAFYRSGEHLAETSRGHTSMVIDMFTTHITL
jgi:hypothetical protein